MPQPPRPSDGIYLCFEDIVFISKPLAHLAKQAGGSLGTRIEFHGNSSLHKKQRMTIQAMLQEAGSHFNNKRCPLDPDVAAGFCGLHNVRHEQNGGAPV